LKLMGVLRATHHQHKGAIKTSTAILREMNVLPLARPVKGSRFLVNDFEGVKQMNREFPIIRKVFRNQHLCRT